MAFIVQAMAFTLEPPAHYELTLTLLVMVPPAYVGVGLL